jgi:hypothetical protein
MLDDPFFGGTGKAALADDSFFGVSTPPGLSNLLADAEKGAAIIPDAEVRDRLVKGCGVVADLAYAFSYIREAQRRLIAEGMVEKDGDDQAMAQTLGSIASELAAVMAQKATHEGSEAQFLTDADDITAYILSQGAFEMSKQNTDLNKGHGGKSSIGKAAHHLRKAGAAHADMMKSFGKMAAMHGGFARKAAAAAALGKAADGTFDHGAAMKLLREAHGHATEAADHMEMAHAALGKGEDTQANADAPGFGNGSVTEGEWGGSAVTGVGEGERTEGEVPWYTADEPYTGKAAQVQGGVPKGYITVEQANLMAENAALRAKVEGFSKTPSSIFKGRSVVSSAIGDQTGTVENTDKLSLLMKGVDGVDANDPESRRTAGGRMIGNMIANSRTFGKSVFDPNFKGAAGTKRVQG